MSLKFGPYLANKAYVISETKSVFSFLSPAPVMKGKPLYSSKLTIKIHF